MSKPTIVLAAGHGYKPDRKFDPGAINPDDGAQEHNYNIKVRDAAIERLHDLNADVNIIEDTSILGAAHEPNWSGLIKYFNSFTPKPDLLVEIHHDYYKAAPAGFGIYSRGITNTAMKYLAANIADAYKMLKLPVKPSYADTRGLGLLRVTRYPTLIWECNAIKKVSPEELKLRGQGIANGIVTYLGLKTGTTMWSAASVYQKFTFSSKDDLAKFHEIMNKSDPLHNTNLEAKILWWKKDNGYYNSPYLKDYMFAKMGITGVTIR